MTAVLVIYGTLALREQIRGQILDRDAVLLEGLARAARMGDEEGLLTFDDPVFALSRMNRLERLLAARLYDVEGNFLLSFPARVRDDPLPDKGWEALAKGLPVTAFHEGYDFTRVLWLTNAVEWESWSERIPMVEVFVPLERLRDMQIDGVAWFLVDGRDVAIAFAALDRNLAIQGGLAMLAAFGVTGCALAWAFRRLSRANALLASRTVDLQRANRELSQSARVAALGAVTAHLMHGLKSPVSGLHSFVASHAQGGGTEEEGAWSDALAATRRMQALIEQVVRVVGDHTEDLEFEAPLREVGEAVVQRARGQAAARRVELRLEGDPPGSVDNRTAGLLILALSNLVENAIEATPAGGEVTLALKAGGARAVCEVRDQGGGIAPEAMERLFQPQRSTKEGGSGLGLAITRQLALALGGSVALASAGPGGCVFRLELPLATLAEDGSESRQESVVEQHG